MLRRRPDDTFEFRQVESALWSARPASLSPERKEALRLRIMSQLEAQEEVRQAPLLLRERWIAIPAGMGIAAAIVAAVQVERATSPDDGHRMVVAHATGDLLVDGRASEQALPGQLIEARSYSWLSLGDDVRLGLEPGSSASFQDDLGRISVRFLHGHLTVANTDSAALIVGNEWTATLAPGTAAMFRMVDGMVVVTVADGEVTIVVGGRTVHVTAGDGPALITGAPSLAPEAPRNLPPAAATPAAAQRHQPTDATSAAPRGSQPPGNESQRADPAGTSAAPEAVPATPPPFENTGFNPPPATKDPEHHDNAGGVAVPPGQAKADGQPASPTPPAATPADPTHPATPHAAATPPPAATPTPPPNPGNSPEWSNAGGNSNGNAGGNGNANPGGNANASASSNTGGNANAGAIGNPGRNANANAGGNANASGGNPNAGPGNSNAGGNGNGKK